MCLFCYESNLLIHGIWSPHEVHVHIEAKALSLLATPIPAGLEST